MKQVRYILSIMLIMCGCERLQPTSPPSEKASSGTPASQIADSQEKRFVIPSKSSPFSEASVALDTTTGKLCKTYPWRDDQKLPQGLPLCSELTAKGESAPGIISFREWQQKRQANHPSDETNRPFIGATKAYRGFTYWFDGTKWVKGNKAEKYNDKTQQMEPWSDDQYDPLGLFTRDEKSKRVLAEAQIRSVANQFSVSYEDALQEAKQQGYKVPSTH